MPVSQTYNDDILSGIAKIPSRSIDCLITSPPYWQLRDYKWDGQWGLEPTFQEYLTHLWQFMDEAWRVLKDEGTVWVNLGDTYGTQSGNFNKPEYNGTSKESNHLKDQAEIKQPKSIHKCLLLIPHRFAIGCIDRGWIIRNDIIWAKRNGMPESVTDRFSKKHEYFFLMVKGEDYYFDLDGVRDKSQARGEIGWLKSGASDKYLNKDRADEGKRQGNHIHKDGKNPGSVSDFWDIPTQPSNDDHYATYNTKLIDKPIIAGCPEGGTILDPFMGTGTTGIRAMELNRNFIGIEGSKEYYEAAEKKFNLFKSQIKIQFA